MRKSTGSYPSLIVDTTAKRVVSHAGAVLLAATAEPDRSGPGTVHGVAAVDAAVGGARPREGAAGPGDLGRDRRRLPGRYRPGQVRARGVRSRGVRSHGVPADRHPRRRCTRPRWPRSTPPGPRSRARVWDLAGTDAPDHQMPAANDPLIIDLDATLITAHSEKELAAATFKRGFGHHPIGAWVDHGAGGTGEPVAMILRKGNAGSNTAVDHIEVTKAALRATAVHPAGSATGAEGADPHRRRRRHPRIPDLADRTTAAVLGRVQPDLDIASRSSNSSRIGVDPRVRRRPATAGRRVGHRTDRAARPVRTGRTGCGSSSAPNDHTPARSCGSPTSNGNRLTAFATNTTRRATPGPGTAAPAPRPLRGPDPEREGHRPEKPSPA